MEVIQALRPALQYSAALFISRRLTYTFAMGRRRKDHFGDRAKREGYPARSVYKLQEIQKKHRILARGQRVLDIGAAPGSWSMFAADTVGAAAEDGGESGGKVVSVDLKEFALPEGYSQVQILTGDAFGKQIGGLLEELGPFDVILSDAAPLTTGNRTIDTARSESLAESCLELASGLLRSGGNMVVKLFQGGGERQLTERLRSLFESVKPYKPSSSRKESFEIFLVAKSFTPRPEFKEGERENE